MYYERFELANGLRVLAAPMQGVRSVTTALFIGAGSRHETDREAGVAHLVEHLLFKGTTRRPSPEDVAGTIERVGGVLNASTDKEATVYWSKTAGFHFGIAVDLIGDMVRHSRLLPREIAKERSVIAEELSMTVDDPQDWVHNLIDEVLWPEQPLGRDVGGTPESVSRLKRTHVLSFMSTFYGANNAVFVAAGGVDTKRVRMAAATHFEDWHAVPGRKPTPASTEVDGARRRLEAKPTEQVNLCLAYPGLAANDPDHYGLDLLASILGGSMTSRLFMEIRERKGLAYDIHAYTNKLIDTGSLVVYAGVDPLRAREALSAIMSQVDRLRRRGVSGAELDRTKEYFKGRLYLGLEDTQSVASWLGTQELLLGKIESPETVGAALDAVSCADILRLANDLLDRRRARLAVIGPNATEVADALAA